MTSTRDWFGTALVEIAREYDHVVVVNCDLAKATRTLPFKEEFPDRFFECGIAEANAIGLAAGLAQEGFRPFVASFGHFLTGKFLEIFQTVGLNDAGVVLVGTHAGLAIGRDGPTQMGLRDLALMRTLPNVQVFHPADGAETWQMMAHLATGRGPSYLRLCRQPQPEVHGDGYRFRFGVPHVVREGTDVVVFAMGGTVPVAVEAADRLAAEGVRPTVVNVSSLPVDRATVARLVGAHRRAVVVEDHHVVGGLADELGRIVLGLPDRPRFDVLAVPDYGQAGPPEDLYRRYRLDAAGIAAFLQETAR
ncbi:transketolase C-terminal domain-containing protein [Actinoallomurus sp. NPDC050550]|uniref:transketolase family protein n=1 Tax=Actinoallomurus sp. NPDC050550 TaxID=3154937 RepID=UPI0033E4A0FC